MTRIEIVRKSLAFASIFIIISVILSGCIGFETDPSGKDSGKINLFKKTPQNKTNSIVKKTNDTVAPSPISYLGAKRGINWINWTWENPKDEDFSYVNIYIDGKIKAKVKKPLNYYNMTKLGSGKQYRIEVSTVDVNNNINPESVEGLSSTLSAPKDELPPDSVWYLAAKVERTSINWTWENPNDKDFSYSNVVVDGVFAANVSKSKNYYVKTGLAPGSTHTISIRTVDSKKNTHSG